MAAVTAVRRQSARQFADDGGMDADYADGQAPAVDAAG